MKFNKDGKVYVHKQDIMNVFNSNLAVPVCLLYRMGLLTGIVCIDDSNRFDLVAFESEEDIKAVNEFGAFADYDDIKHLSIDELKANLDKRLKEINETKEMLWSLTNKTEKQTMAKKYERLLFQALSIRDFLYYKSGVIDMKIPNGIEIERETPPKSKGSILDGLRKKLKKKNKKDNN
jgi:hypothetical protein